MRPLISTNRLYQQQSMPNYPVEGVARSREMLALSMTAFADRLGGTSP